MNKADDSHTPDAIRFINQRNKIVLKEFIKNKIIKKNQAIFPEEKQSQIPGDNSFFSVGKTFSSPGDSVVEL